MGWLDGKITRFWIQAASVAKWHFMPRVGEGCMQGSASKAGMLLPACWDKQPVLLLCCM